MDGTVTCGSCPHVGALHRAGGSCRVNGCPCLAFTSVVQSADVYADEPDPPYDGHRRLAAIVLPPAIAFMAGLILGLTQ